jgi:uncharacterized membrane protein
MFRKQGLHFLLFILVAGILSSCSTGNKFASSFGKRKYLKGYYVDVPSESKEPVIAASTGKPSTPPIINKNVGHVYLTDEVITLKTKGTISTISIKNNSATPSLNSKKNPSSKQESVLQQKTIKKVLPPADDTKFADSKHEVNLWAILGCALAIIGTVITSLSGSFTLLSIIVLSLAGIVCIYSLFQNKFYYTWLAIIGLSAIIFIFVLILL